MKPEELKDRAEALATRMVEMMHGNYGMLDIVDELLTALQQAVDARWISVEEGLPEDAHLVDACDVTTCYRSICYRQFGAWWDAMTELEPKFDITHWCERQPIPAIRAGKQTVQEESEGV